MNIKEIPITGIVYRFIFGDYHYTGSTCDTIHNRYKSHITAYKTHCIKEQTRKLYTFIKTLEDEWDSVRISILERDIPIEKIFIKEQSYINKDDPFCLNTYNSIAPVIKVVLKQNRTPVKKQYDLDYYQKNKERIKEARRIQYQKAKEDPLRYSIHLKQSRESQKRFQLKVKAQDIPD